MVKASPHKTLLGWGEREFPSLPHGLPGFLEEMTPITFNNNKVNERLP